MNRLVRLLLVAALALGVGAPALADDSGSGTNEAEAINQKNGASVFDLALDIRRVTSSVVDETNTSLAYANCESCQTVAIAIQIVLVDGPIDTVTPTNLAVALNEACNTCQTLALAYQIVFGTGEPLEFTQAGRKELKRIRKELEGLGDSGLTTEEIRARTEALVEDIRGVLRTGLVPREPNDERDDDKFPDRSDEDQGESPDGAPAGPEEPDPPPQEPAPVAPGPGTTAPEPAPVAPDPGATAPAEPGTTTSAP